MGGEGRGGEGRRSEERGGEYLEMRTPLYTVELL